MVGMDGCVNSPILTEVGAENKSLSCNYNKSQQVNEMGAMLPRALVPASWERSDCKKEADVPRWKDKREEKRASWWVLFPTPFFFFFFWHLPMSFLLGKSFMLWRILHFSQACFIGVSSWLEPKCPIQRSKASVCGAVSVVKLMPGTTQISSHAWSLRKEEANDP